MIYDGFSFFNEFEMLKLRCEELKALNPTHILVESHHTHQGERKPLYFVQKQHLFRDYNIVHYVHKGLNPNPDPWVNERAQRDLIMIGSIKDGDTLLVTDADEIPKAEAIKNWKGQCSALLMRGNRYYLNRMPHDGCWEKGRIMTGAYARGKSLSAIRNTPCQTIPDAGWHFSWMGGAERRLLKLRSFAHQELNNGFFCDERYWQYELSKEDFERLDAAYPRYLVENQSEFSHLLHPPTAQLITVSRSGVGDRIRLMLNGHLLAQQLGREHLHFWEPNEHCGAEFEDLFWSPALRVVKPYPIPRTQEIDVELMPWVQTAKALADDVSPNILLHSFAEDCDVSTFRLPLITFAPSIWGRATEFYREAGLTDAVGVHVRGTDYKHRMPPLDDYFKAIEQHWLGQVFLATDDPKVREQFRSRYKDRLVEFPVSAYGRGDRTATIESVIELCILRMCRRLVLSAYSSFSMLAIRTNNSKRGNGIRII